MINALSVDVEEYFQVYALSSQISREQWPAWPSRVEASTRDVLLLLAQRQVKATFFILGWVAVRCPGLVREIAAAGHEVASHGMDHRRVDRMTPAEFYADASQSKAILEELTGERVVGYRAPNYSIGRDTVWALETLAAAGYLYSSSIYPIRHDHYGFPEMGPVPCHPHPRGVLEIPVASLHWGGMQIPAAGGGYFRLYPYGLSRWLLERYNRRFGAAVFFLHPWELDAGQPRIEGLPFRARFRHYHNMHRTSGRLARLLGDFSWAPVRQVFCPAAGPN